MARLGIEKQTDRQAEQPATRQKQTADRQAGNQNSRQKQLAHHRWCCSCSGNGAASVPSLILGAFSRPVPPPSTDDRRKDVRSRAADAASGTARWKRKATEQSKKQTETASNKTDYVSGRFLVSLDLGFPLRLQRTMATPRRRFMHVGHDERSGSEPDIRPTCPVASTRAVDSWCQGKQSKQINRTV